MRCIYVLALIFGSSAAVFAQPAENTGHASSALTASDTAHFWTAQRVIPMCWHILQFPSLAEQQAAQDFVMRAIREGWLDLINLDATWTNCPTSGSDRHVRVLLRSGDASENGTTLQPGTLTLSTPDDRRRQPPNDPPGLLMGFPGTWNNSNGTRAQFQSLILHEFGHVLGFGHEQDRPDGGSGVACYNTNFPNTVKIGPPDPQSIMGWSYCTTAIGHLSLDDIHGVREIYGARPINNLVPTIAGIVANVALH
jgi:hypothetical protein